MYRMAPSAYLYAAIVCLFLSVTHGKVIDIAIDSSIPTDWAERVYSFNALYSADDLKIQIDLPLIGNGYLSNNDGVTSNVMYVSGVFNGESTSPSHRADIPSTLNNVRVDKATPLGALLDIERATYYRRGVLASVNSTNHLRSQNSLDSWYELRWYAHRSLRNVYVMEMQVFLADGEDSVTISLTRGRAEVNTDLTTLYSDSDNSTTTFCSVTKVPETSDGPVQTLCSVSTILPSTMTLSAAESGQTFTFLQTLVTSLDLDMEEDGRLVGSSSYEAILHVTKQKYASAMSLADIGQLHSTHVNEWAQLWTSGVEIRGRSDVAIATNTSLYYILSSVRDDWPYGLAPGGLTNSYNGHSFWDTETWMYPPLLYLHPSISQSLIQYRFDRLDGARLKAASYDPPFSGVMFPWESAFSGQETCPTWASTGLREDHISGDIAYAVWQEWTIRRNETWLRNIGYPILAGVAEFWVSIASYSSDGTAHVTDIIPPDEYVDHVDDSVYTNFVAAQSLRFAVAAAQQLQIQCDQCDKYSKLASDLVILYNSTLGVHPEYSGYNGDVVKQADVILLHYPLGMSMAADSIGADLSYYSSRTDKNGPAMTWGMFSIGYLDLLRFEDAAMYFNMSFQDNTHAPFSVWTETPTGGAENFVTGAGGYLQTMTAGYPGMRLLASSSSTTATATATSKAISTVDLDSMSFGPICPEFSTYVKVRSFDYMNCKFDFAYWCTGESVDNTPTQVELTIQSCNNLHATGQFEFHHYQSDSVKDFFPFPSSKPHQSFRLGVDKTSRRVVVNTDDKQLVNRYILRSF